MESESSRPLVVMTNQKQVERARFFRLSEVCRVNFALQWEACERVILMRDAFSGQLEVSGVLLLFPKAL